VTLPESGWLHRPGANEQGDRQPPLPEPDAIKNHVVHIMEKLGAQDRTQAAVFAIRNGLVK
jgi:hypothetical protein